MITLGLGLRESNKVPNCWDLVSSLSPTDTANLLLSELKSSFFVSEDSVEGYPNAVSCDVYGLTEFGVVVKVLNLLVWGGSDRTSYIGLWIPFWVPVESGIPRMNDGEGIRLETGVEYPLAHERGETVGKIFDVIRSIAYTTA